MTSFKSVFWSSCISFSRCSTLDIRQIFTFAFSCSLSRSSRRILPILMSFLTFLSAFLDSLYALYLLLPAYFRSKPFLHELELKQFPPVEKALALPVLLLCELIRNCKILRITVQLQPHRYDFPLKPRVANYLLTQPHIY